jgi:hypothetical protein
MVTAFSALRSSHPVSIPACLTFDRSSWNARVAEVASGRSSGQRDENPPVVLVHVAGNSGRVRVFWQEELARRGWSSHTIDLRGQRLTGEERDTEKPVRTAVPIDDRE